MDTWAQGLEITGVAMALVFLALVIVALLIGALGKVFRTPAAASPAAARPKPAPVTARTSAASTDEAAVLADQAAVLAVALALGRQRAGGAPPVAEAAARAPMPWERPFSLDDDAMPEGETVTVITVAPGSANWKAQGRLKAME